MITVEYDETEGGFYARCRDDVCRGWTSATFDRIDDANQAADRHEELHNDGVVR